MLKCRTETQVQICLIQTPLRMQGSSFVIRKANRRPHADDFGTYVNDVEKRSSLALQVHK